MTAKRKVTPPPKRAQPKRAQKKTKSQPKPTVHKQARKILPPPVTTKVSPTMTDPCNTVAPSTTAVEALLADIAAKLGELVQIETYLATKASEAPVPTPAAVAVAAPSAGIGTAPACMTTGAATPEKRPGAGTVGGLTWDVCDYLTQQNGKAPTKDEVLALIKLQMPVYNGQPINDLTVSTQYSKWRSAQGLPRLPRGFGAQHAAVPVPSAPTIGAAPVAAAAAPPLPTVPVQSVPAFSVPSQLPIPAASVPSVIAPLAAPTPAPASPPPWLRS